MRIVVMLGLVVAVSADAAPDDNAADNVPVSVASRLDGATVVLDAHYVFHHVEAGSQPGFAEIEVPEGAVVTSAAVVIEGKRHSLVLGRADELDDSFSRVTSGAAEGDPARAILVRGHDAGVATVDVALPVASVVELELVFTAQTCLFGDSRFAAVPEDWSIGAIDSKDIAASCGDRFPSATRWVRFATTELDGAPDHVGVTGGRLVAAHAHVARVELDLPMSLADTPPDLATAIVIDASRSMTAAHLDAQRELVLAYLKRVPRSRVQVIATTRTPTALLPGWMPADSVAPRLERELRHLTLKNGSSFDAAIAIADRWLAQIGGTHRMIVIGDGELPSRLDASPPMAHVLTHVVELDPGATGLVRDDNAALASVAKATTGIALRGGSKDVDTTILVRPIALDGVTIANKGWKQLDPGTTCNDVLDAGHSCTWWFTGTAVSSPIVIDGLLWNRKVSRIVQLDPRRAMAMARELSVSRPFDEPVQHAVDDAAHAVNQSWSLGVFWGGSAGYDTVIVHSGSIGTSSRDGGIGTSGRSIGTVVRQSDLRSQLAPAFDRCHADGHRVSIDLETTHKEIVEVAVDLTPADDALRGCLVEAVWDTELDPGDHIPRATRHVALGP